MTINKTTELLPCPFCGGDGVAEGFDGRNVGCSNVECPAGEINFSAKAWNKRAAFEQPAVREMTMWDTSLELVINQIESPQTLRAMLQACEGLEDLEDCMVAARRVIVEVINPKYPV